MDEEKALGTRLGKKITAKIATFGDVTGLLLVTFKIEGGKQYIFLSANKDPFCTPNWVCSVDLALRF